MKGLWKTLALVAIILGIHTVVSTDTWAANEFEDLAAECDMIISSFNPIKMKCQNKKCKEVTDDDGNIIKRKCLKKNRCCYVQECQEWLCLPRLKETGNKLELTQGNE
ncbi:uncharacterized protein LOC117321289 [Pecten maximus]|uniref:uncharacterized protein LOC117321289 n=1 Tax=Pecten maximus TaxID=6579 RepID=UPI0014589870|nr:uncharacterized protein LOC117321289 [Pecten maximus]